MAYRKCGTNIVAAVVYSLRLIMKKLFFNCCSMLGRPEMP